MKSVLTWNERGEDDLSKITLDINKCANYTVQIQQLNRRIKELDKAIYDLYDEIGWGNHYYLRQVDGTVSYSRKLENCGSYLSYVGNEFNKAENKLYMSDISELSNYRGIQGWIASNTLFYKIEHLGQGYLEIVDEFIDDKIKELYDKAGAYGSWADKLVGGYEWLVGDIYGGIDDIKSLVEDIMAERSGEEIKLLPEGFSDFMDTLSNGQLLIDITKAAKEYSQTGDAIEAFDDVSFSIFGKAVKKIDKVINKSNNLKYVGMQAMAQDVLLSTIIKMPQKWYEGVKEYAKNGTGSLGTIMYDTTVGAFTDAVVDGVKLRYTAATAITYPIADQVCEAFGYDLSGEYERLTGETGLKAVFQAQKELWVDVVYEGVKDKATDVVDGFYDTVSKGWESWKSGMGLIFGRK